MAVVHRDYQRTRNTRRSSITIVDRMRGGKLMPCACEPIRMSEGGLLSQSITMELDPIAGRMITPIRGEVTAVFVPVQAIDAIKAPEAAYAGMTEVLREKLLSGNPLFGLEAEGEISMRCGINPRSIGGQKRVNEMVRLAHNAAVNYLRQRKYVKATLLLHSNLVVTPAIISQTVLERMNGVLDPDDHINGSFSLDVNLPAMKLPVNLGIQNMGGAQAHTVTETGHTATSSITGWRVGENYNSGGSGNATLVVKQGSTIYPDINAVFAARTIGNEISLVDFYNAELRDQMTRVMRKLVDENPQYGEENVLRWAHGLSLDTGKIPFVVFHEERMFGRQIVPAMDTGGVQTDVMRSDMALQFEFTIPVPKTELGGVIMTFISLKPDETISSQPHPILSDVWGAENFVADELALDPVPVTIRELDADCTPGQEATVALYTGLNQLRALYVHYGLSRRLDPETVENKTAIWQLEVPLSVTPDTILYPTNLNHYPFADQSAEVCTYVMSSKLVLRTPMIMGPTPVETLAVIEDEDIFGESENG